MQRWTNWARTMRAIPDTVVAPRDAAEAAEAIRAAAQAGKPVRPLGSGHSFTGIGSPASAYALDLRHWSGIVHADLDTLLVKVWAGTPLYRLNADLDRLGLAMANLGDIDQQTLAGAISTGTHGTGAKLGGLATQVEELELLTADGTEMRCSATENSELFAAARVGLGSLGVITTVTLRCVRAFTLAAEEKPTPLAETLEGFAELADGNDHFVFYWFPHTTKTLVQRHNRHPEPAKPLSPARYFVEFELLENHCFGAICTLGRAVPSLVRPLNRLCAATWSGRSYSDRSYRVLTAPRRIRFVESEYALPREVLPEVITELAAAAEKLTEPVMFPVEVRVAAADDIWLSTAYQRETAYVAIHQFQGMPYRQWFKTFQRIADEAWGRPHWGKIHSLDAAALRERYPRFGDFRRIRASVDPDSLFRTEYLDRILGPCGSA